MSESEEELKQRLDIYDSFARKLERSKRNMRRQQRREAGYVVEEDEADTEEEEAKREAAKKQEDEEDDEKEDEDDEEEDEKDDKNDNEEEEEEEEEEEVDGDDDEEEEEEEEVDGDDDEEEVNSKASPSFLFLILKDPNLLHCPVCRCPLASPIYQCDNGHIACSSCCCNIENVCHSCSSSIGYIRCRAMENVLESIKIPCMNIRYGCKVTTSYNKRHEHELMCIHEPCSCPHRGCDFVASSNLVYLHYYNSHTHSGIAFDYNSYFTVPVKNDMKYVVLQEKTDKTLFVFNYAFHSIANVASITCISPSSVKKGFSYKLVARKGNSNIKLESFAECAPKWSEYVPRGEFLLVPTDFLDGDSLHVRIRSEGQGNP